LLYHPYLKIELTAESVVVLNSISVPPLTYYPIEFNNGFSEKGNFLTFPKRLDPGVNYYMAVPFADSEKKTVKLDFEGKLRSLRIDNSDYVLAKRIITKAKGGYLIQNAGTRFDKKRMVFEDRSIFEFDKKLADEIVDAGCAAAMLVRTDLLKKYGGFWDKYVMYWEDSELSFRLGRAGYKTKFVNDAVVYHQYWGSSGSKVTGLQTFYGTRNRLWFIRRYFGIFMFIYYYLRTAARTSVWGVNSLRGKVDARMFFLSYFRALVSALGRDNT